jgi:hypothetical protein
MISYFVQKTDKPKLFFKSTIVESPNVFSLYSASSKTSKKIFLIFFSPPILNLIRMKTLPVFPIYLNCQIFVLTKISIGCMITENIN